MREMSPQGPEARQADRQASDPVSAQPAEPSGLPRQRENFSAAADASDPRMQHEELLRENQELRAKLARYFDLYDLAPVSYLALDKNGVIQEINLTFATLLGVPRDSLPGKRLARFVSRMEVNDTLCRMTGYTRLELVGKPTRLLYASPDLHATAGREVPEQIERTGTASLETEWRAQSGETFPVLLGASPLDARDRDMGAVVTVMDIRQRRQAEAALRRQLHFEKTVVGLASELAHVSAESLDRSIGKALRSLGSFIEADRAYLFRFRTTDRRFDITHEWCRQGVTPQKERMQDVPMESFPWYCEQTQSRDFLYVPDVDHLPPAARAEQTELKRQEIQSLLNVPVQRDTTTEYALGFDFVREKHELPHDRIQLLKVAGQALGEALESRMRHQGAGSQ